MCNLSQGVEDAAKKKAKKKQDLRHIQLLMKKMNLTAPEAMNLLEIPVNKQKKYEKLISS